VDRHWPDGSGARGLRGERSSANEICRGERTTAMRTKADRPKVPKFVKKSEEAKWWDDHEDMIERNLIQAMRDGTVLRGTAQRLAPEAPVSRDVTIRIAEADLDLAQAGGSERTAAPDLHRLFCMRHIVRGRNELADICATGARKGLPRVGTATG